MMRATLQPHIILPRYVRGVLRCCVSTTAVPVGIFVDLDNVGPETHSRDDARDFAQPLRCFAETVGKLSTFQAFANQATQTYVSESERQRRKDIWDDFDLQEFLWDDEVFQTGYDEDGILRCGVCGAKMKLTKKDKRAGRTLQDKLDKHMRMLHDREQEKRSKRASQLKRKGKNLNEKDQQRSIKYKQAQVGLFRTPATREKKKQPRTKKNDLFQVLREQKILCVATNQVDSTLVRAAHKWIQNTRRRNKKEKDESILNYGCLVVVSEDSDFNPLLRHASSQGFVAVSATPASTKQTRAMVDASDLVLTQSTNGEFDKFGSLKPWVITSKGVDLLMDVDDSSDSPDDQKDESESSAITSPLLDRHQCRQQIDV